MAVYEVEDSREFEAWRDSLSEAERESVLAGILMLEQRGPAVGYPFAARVPSRHQNLRELRVRHEARERRYLIFFAIDPRDVVILLNGGDPTGDYRFYERFVPEAERIYDDHLRQI